MSEDSPLTNPFISRTEQRYRDKYSGPTERVQLSLDRRLWRMFRDVAQKNCLRPSMQLKLIIMIYTEDEIKTRQHNPLIDQLDRMRRRVDPALYDAFNERWKNLETLYAERDGDATEDDRARAKAARKSLSRLFKRITESLDPDVAAADADGVQPD